MADKCGCECGAAPRLIFACSGSADVGEVADRAARKMTADGTGRMACLAGIGGRVSGIIKSAEAADDILVIDGCPLRCAGNSMEQAGLREYKHLQLADLGMEKGKTAVNEQNIARIAAIGTGMIGASSCCK